MNLPQASAAVAMARRHGTFLLSLTVMVVGTLTAFSYIVWRLHEEAFRQGSATLQVHSRNFEEQLTQALQVVSLTAISLDAAVEKRDHSSELSRRLTYAVRPLAFVRSLSVVDAQGRIIASSNPSNVGQTVPVDSFFPHVHGASDVLRVGQAWFGRDVVTASQTQHNAESAPTGPMLIPVLRSIPTSGAPVWLLAALNNDYFVNASLQMLEPQQDHVDWFRYDGILLLSSDPQRALNRKDGQLQLESRMEEAESGVIANTAHPDSGQAVMTAFRTSSRFPVIVAVGTDRAALTRQWASESARIAAVVLPVLIALVVASSVVHRRRIAFERQAQEVHRQQQLAATVFESSPEAIIITDVQARIISVNAAFATVTGYQFDEVQGQNPRMLGSGLQDAAFYQAMWSDIQVQGHWQGKLINRRKNGTLYTVWVVISVVRGTDGALRHYTGVLQDISEQESAQQRLQVAAGVFDHAREGIMITDVQGNILDVNAAFTSITGYPREEVLGHNTRLLSSGHQSATFYAQMWATLQSQGHWSGEVINRRRDGEVYSEHLTISTVTGAQGQALRYVALFSDITEKKKQERRLLQMAHYDALTGLPNRVLLSDRLRQAMAHAHRTGQRLAVLFLDLDGFKTVNDKYGHEAGDQLLIELAQRMRKALRENDTLARIGGDEFVAVLTGAASPSSCTVLLNRMIESCSKPFVHHGQSLRVSASLGVTMYPQADDVDAEQLMRQADQAMYQAKVMGKNRFHFFDASHDSDVRNRHEQLQRIQGGLSRREFVLHYQPKVNMRSGELLGFEALLRWQPPGEGIIPPGQFLPHLHGHPMALDLGRWVLDTALAQLDAWQREGRRAEISVNIDPIHLQSDSFVAELEARLLHYTHIDPGQLELEILESSAMDDVELVSDVMRRCRKLGVRFALDDFGTGYSSLNYLRHLPTQTVKIDQSFVRGILNNADDLAILEGVIGLSVAFRRQLIAEGVETSAHGELLLKLGCEGGQGFAIARPMPAAEVWNWYAQWRPQFAVLPSKDA